MKTIAKYCVYCASRHMHPHVASMWAGWVLKKKRRDNLVNSAYCGCRFTIYNIYKKARFKVSGSGKEEKSKKIKL